MFSSLPRSYLRVASTISSNLASGYLLAIPIAFVTSGNPVFILTGNIITATICTWISIKLEDALELYDKP